jgi:hypothetical protein
MLTDTSAIRTYFAKLGLEQEIADIYLALHANGPQTMSELSRSSKIERTRIYRLVDKLLESNLIEVDAQHKRGVIKAAPIANLSILIQQKELELRSLRDDLELIQQVLARNSLSSPAARVQFFYGPEGIRQKLWNELDAKSVVVGYHHPHTDDIPGKQFMAKWTSELKERNAKRQIADDDSKDHSCHTYDDVVAYYLWKDGEAYGIELRNTEIAAMQRQLLQIASH